MSPFCPTSRYMAMPIKALSSTIPFHCSWFPYSVCITCEHLAGIDAASWVRHTSSNTECRGALVQWWKGTPQRHLCSYSADSPHKEGQHPGHWSEAHYFKNRSPLWDEIWKRRALDHRDQWFKTNHLKFSWYIQLSGILVNFFLVFGIR